MDEEDAAAPVGGDRGAGSRRPRALPRSSRGSWATAPGSGAGPALLLPRTVRRRGALQTGRSRADRLRPPGPRVSAQDPAVLRRRRDPARRLLAGAEATGSSETGCLQVGGSGICLGSSPGSGPWRGFRALRHRCLRPWSVWWCRRALMCTLGSNSAQPRFADHLLCGGPGARSLGNRKKRFLRRFPAFGSLGNGIHSFIHWPCGLSKSRRAPLLFFSTAAIFVLLSSVTTCSWE